MPTNTGDHFHRSTFRTDDEDEITDFLRNQYIGSRTTFGHVHGPAEFRAATTMSPQISGDHARSGSPLLTADLQPIAARLEGESRLGFGRPHRGSA